MSTSIEQITSPTLLVDEQKCRANIRRMAQKARNKNLGFRPHFKTHQSADIGEWFRDEGTTGITVSSVKMAVYFANHGWDDITIAFPVNIRELNTINELAKDITLTLLLSDSDVPEALNKGLETNVYAFIEIDTGSNRTGFKVTDADTIDNLLEELEQLKYITWKGFYSHPGHSYSARSKEEILKIHSDVTDQVTALRNRYGSSAQPFTICIGDTPCCSVAEDFSSIDQISPGNFVFYDLVQVQIGSCNPKDIAVALACPVVAKYPFRNQIIVHGGAIHLSKDVFSSETTSHFGLPVFLENGKWDEPIPGAQIASVSQEHGVISCPDKELNRIKYGDLIGILPVHSCLTADLMAGYETFEGDKLNHIRTNRKNS